VRALLDTSYFIATETGRPLREIPEVTETEVSVVTVAELTLGVLVASDEVRASRLATLSAFDSNWDPLPVDAHVARKFAQVVASLRAAKRRVPVLDALVAATALAEEIPVVTQDNDYPVIPGLEVIRV
jgi:hypothetical protein